MNRIEKAIRGCNSIRSECVIAYLLMRTRNSPPFRFVPPCLRVLIPILILSSHGQKRPIPLSRSGSPEPTGRAADRTARPGAGQPGRGASLAAVGLCRRIRRASRIRRRRRSRGISTGGCIFGREKYFIKQYEMETNFVCHLILDCSASMRYGDEDAAEAALRGPHGHDAGSCRGPAERQGFAGNVR